MARKTKNDLKYFYLDGSLYKILRVIRPEDLVECWNYTESKTQMLMWSYVRKKAQRALSLQEVCTLLGRTRVTIENYILEGKIPAPQKMYSISLKKTPGRYMFSEKDIMDLHDFLLTVHIGRPRADGKITPKPMPSKVELRAMIRQDTVLYVKNDEGDFVPVWKEVDW